MKHPILCLIALVAIVITTTLHSSDAIKEEPLILPDKLKQDFNQLYDQLQKSHINLFANRDKPAYDHLFEHTLQKLDAPLTPLQAQILFQKFTAAGDIAHANIAFPNEAYTSYRESNGTAFPIYVEIIDGRWFTTLDYSSHNLVKGTEILTIQGVDVTDLFKTLKAHISADTDAIASSLLEFQLPQYLWLIDIENSRFTKEFNLTIVQNQIRKSIIVKALSKDQLLASKTVENNPTKNESKIREFATLKDNISYLRPGPFYNAEDIDNLWDNSQFTQFIDDAFAHFIDTESKQLIIDLRNNPGGNNSFSDHLIAWFATEPFKFASTFLVKSSLQAKLSNEQRLNDISDDNSASHQLAKRYEKTPFGETFEFPIPLTNPRKGRRYEGEVYVLIDRHSYSNAASVAAITQDYGFGIIAGEATTDFATTYASMETFTLKHTNIEVGFPKAHIIRPSGTIEPGPVEPELVLDKLNDEDDPMLQRLISLLQYRIRGG